MISVLVFSVQATLALPACPSIGHFNTALAPTLGTMAKYTLVSGRITKVTD